MNLLSDEEYVSYVSKTFDEISKGENSINFIPILIANNQFDGGLGPVRFKSIGECGLSNQQLLGEKPVTKEEFIKFYEKVAVIVPRLKFGKERIQKVMTKITVFYKVHGEEYKYRVNKLVQLFKTVDKDLSGTLQRDELTQQYDDEKDLNEDRKRRLSVTFNWVDRNADGSVSIFELISGAMNKSMLEISREAWCARLIEIGFRIDKV